MKAHVLMAAPAAFAVQARTRLYRLPIGIACLPRLAAICLAALPSFPSHAGPPENASGLLIIYVDVVRLNNAGEPIWLEGASNYYIKNMKTGREYGSSLSSWRGIDAQEVEEGIYCLESVRGGPNFTQLDYCDEPFFKVVAGKVNNAGWWRIGYSIDPGPAFRGTVRLVYGAKRFNEVLDLAKQYEKESLRKYGVAVGD